MGLFGKKKPKYQELETSSPVAEVFNSRKNQVKTVLDAHEDNIEMIPGKEKTYFYIGKPPKMFGFAWHDGSRVIELKDVIREKKFIPMRIDMVVGELRKAYEETMNDPRYSALVDDKRVIITDSSGVDSHLEEICARILK